MESPNRCQDRLERRAPVALPHAAVGRRPDRRSRGADGSHLPRRNRRVSLEVPLGDGTSVHLAQRPPVSWVEGEAGPIAMSSRPCVAVHLEVDAEIQDDDSDY